MQDVAVFLGWQEGVPQRNFPDIALWNLLIDIPDHPTGSTICTATLHKAGYMVEEPTR